YTKPPEEYVIPKRVYFVIREGDAPLTPDTGLFVYTAKAGQTAYYAVTSVNAGVESRQFQVAGPIAERVEFPDAVRQNDLDFVHWTDGTAYNFRLRAPEGKGPFPLIGFLHGAFLQYSSASMGGPAETGAARIAFDAPIMRGRIQGIPDEQYPNQSWAV